MEQSHDIVDMGVNLAHRSFQADRKEVIERAFAAGVWTMIITGTSLAGSHEALRIAREYPGQLFATAGVHPHDSRNCTPDTISELCRLATHKAVVAIGECGLDSIGISRRGRRRRTGSRRMLRSPRNCRCRSFCMSVMRIGGSAKSWPQSGRQSRPCFIE